MNRRFLPALLFSCALLPLLRAAPVERDLGDGLRYFRLHELPADLPINAAKSHPVVIDLRFTAATEPGAVALDAWLKSHATPDAPVFVLLNADTASALRPGFVAGHRPGAGVITIAPASSALTPDIALAVPPADDRRAYDAFEHGATVAALITENPDKPRHDEAELARERANPPDDVDDTDAIVTDPAAEKDAAPPPPIIDALLERAVQLYRGLRALHRIS
jgi:hypothetical protein